MLLKILIVLILVGYVFNKIATFVFRGAFKGFPNDSYRQQRYTKNARRAPDSNLNIDNIPNRSSKKSEGFSGGEYVDYEEVK